MKKHLPLMLAFMLALTGCVPATTTPLPSVSQPTEETKLITITPTPTNEPNTEEPTDSTLNATLNEVEGNVEAKNIEEIDFSTAADGRTIEEEGQVRTLEDGYTRVDLSTGTLIRMAPHSYFTLLENQPKDEGLFTRIKLEIGQIWVVLNGGSLEVTTPSGEASVRGSYMMVEINPETKEVIITCLEGNCTLKNPAGTLALINGQRAKLQPPELTGGAFVLPVIQKMSERDFAAWLFFVPESKEIFPFLEKEKVLPWENWQDFVPDENEPWLDFEATLPDDPFFSGDLLPGEEGTLLDGDGTLLDGDGTLLDGDGPLGDGLPDGIGDGLGDGVTPRR